MKKLAIGLGLAAAAGAAVALIRRKRGGAQELEWSPSYPGDGDLTGNDRLEGFSETEAGSTERFPPADSQ